MSHDYRTRNYQRTSLRQHLRGTQAVSRRGVYETVSNRIIEINKIIAIGYRQKLGKIFIGDNEIDNS
jgi:hypothetical protein